MKKILVSIFALVLGVQAFGQAVPFLNIPTNAEQLGLAGASVSNYVAGKGDIRFTYGSWAPKSVGTSIISADAAFKFGKIGFSIEGKFFNDQAVKLYSETGASAGTFTPKEMYFGAGFSYWIADALNIGVKGRFVSSSIYKNTSASAFAADVEFKYVKNAFAAGVAVCNIGSKVKYGSAGTENKLPSLLKFGAQYKAQFGLKGVLEGDYLFAGGFMGSAAAEYSIKEIAFLRLGYHFGNDTKTIPSFVSAGLGVKFKGISLDAAYLFGSKILSNTLMITLGYSF